MQKNTHSPNLAEKYQLNAYQEAFCNHYVELGDAQEAYDKSFGKKGNSENAKRYAYKLLQNPKIATRIMQIRAQHAGKYDVTREMLTENLVWGIMTARERGHVEQVRKNTMDIAKLHGLIIEQSLELNPTQFKQMGSVVVNGQALKFDIGDTVEVEAVAQQIETKNKSGGKGGTPPVNNKLLLKKTEELF